MIEEDDIPDDWEMKKFGDVVESSLYGCNPETGEDIEGVSYLRISDINAEGQIKSNPLPQNAKFENEEQAEKYTLSEGDVVIARSGSIGQAYVYNEQDDRMVYASYLIRFSLDTEQVLTEFIDVYTRTPMYWKQVHSAGKGAVQTNINAGSIKDFDVPVPPLDEQERIVEAVEERLERVERLETSVANVGRLADEYQESTRKSLFFGESVDSNQSMVLDNLGAENLPEEWDIHRFEDIIQFQSGYAFESSDYVQESEESVLCFRSGDYNTRGEYKPESEKKYLPKNFIDEYPKHKLDKGDIIMTMVGANCGKMYMIGEKELPALLNQNMWRIRTADDLNDDYCYNYMKAIEDKIRFTEKGAARQYLAQKDIKEIKIPVPPVSQQEEIIEVLERIDFGLLRKSVSDIDTLFSEYRNSVLSHAFRGKIDY